jgi:hypothetical protein
MIDDRSIPFNDKRKLEQIALQVIFVLKGQFESFPESVTTNRNAPFHEAFLEAFKGRLREDVDTPYPISLSRWSHGMNTILEQVFFENVAHILSGGYKRSFSSDKQTNLKITQAQRSAITEIISSLKNSTTRPSVDEEDKILFAGWSDSNIVDAQDFTVDNFFETETSIDAIELKSVRPNAGEIRGEKQKVLNAKAALARRFPGKQVKYYFGFPFDPWSNTPTGYDKGRFLNNIIEGRKFLDEKEVLLSEELWDMLSGQVKTMNAILDVINQIAKPEFMDKFLLINDPMNRENGDYLSILRDWGLVRELRIVENLTTIRTACQGKTMLTNYLTMPPFKDDGRYQKARAEKLISLIR